MDNPFNISLRENFLFISFFTVLNQNENKNTIHLLLSIHIFSSSLCQEILDPFCDVALDIVHWKRVLYPLQEVLSPFLLFFSSYYTFLVSEIFFYRVPTVILIYWFWILPSFTLLVEQR